MATSAIGSSGKIQTDYMRLLITQLQNQNPLEPMDNNEMAAQLAQFSQLEQLESINSNFGEMNAKFGSMDSSFANVLAASNRDYANSLLERKVSYLFNNDLNGTVEKKDGVVSKVASDVDGEPYLFVNRHNLGLEEMANSLMGKEISYFTKVGDKRLMVDGKITGFNSSILGKESLMIDGHTVDIKDVITDSLIDHEVTHLVTDELTGQQQMEKFIVNDIWNDDNNKMIFSTGRFITLDNVIAVE